MRYKAVKLSRNLWYVQHLHTKRFYFERYTHEATALAVAKTLEEKADEDSTVRADFVLRPHLCSTIGEAPKELALVDAESGFWFIEHAETGTFYFYKYSDYEAAERCLGYMLDFWDKDPKAKARAMAAGYFVSSPSFVRERPLCS